MPPSDGNGLQADQLQDVQGFMPGMSYYSVFELKPVLQAGGQPMYEVTGPFPTLGAATQVAARKPGSLIAVTLFLHQADAGIVVVGAGGKPVTRAPKG